MTIKSNIIAAHLGGQIAALDVDRAQDLLMMEWPADDQTAFHDRADAAVMAGPVEVQRGERYAVSRRVAVMPVRGILTPASRVLEYYLGWATYQGIEESCAALADDDEVAAVVMDMNTPGGMVLQCEGAGRAIAALAAVKPVHVIANPMAASAGYWLAAQGSDLSVVPGGEVGSIGTMRMSVWPVEVGAHGDKWGVHVSSHARAKNPNPTDEIGLAEIQRSLDESEAIFLDAVASGRGLDRATLSARLSVTDNVADGGAMYRVADAIARGLADAEETRAAFYDRIFAAYAPPPVAGARRGQSALAQAAAAQARSVT